jgi:hypothetical protein
MAKAFIPNGRINRKLPTAVSGKTDAVFQETYIFSRYGADELYCESKNWFLQLTWDKK